MTDSAGIAIGRIANGGIAPIAGNINAQVVITSIGVLQRVSIGRRIDGATFYFEDNNGNAVTGLPSQTSPFDLDQGGTYDFGREITNGLKITTTGFLTGVITVLITI
jgi:hypothetical protein